MFYSIYEIQTGNHNVTLLKSMTIHGVYTIYLK